MSEMITFSVPKIKCEGCVDTIRQGLSEIGFSESETEFDIENKKLIITGENLDKDKIVQKMAKINFPAEVVKSEK